MKIALLVISILLIAIVLLQSGSGGAETRSVSGNNDSLFANRKERGGELFITRLTWALGIAFFALCIIMSL